MAGFRLARNESVNYLAKNLSIKTDTLTDDHIISAAKTSMSSKLLGAESDFFAKMVFDAMKGVKMVNAQG